MISEPQLEALAARLARRTLDLVVAAVSSGLVAVFGGPGWAIVATFMLAYRIEVRSWREDGDAPSR